MQDGRWYQRVTVHEFVEHAWTKDQILESAPGIENAFRCGGEGAKPYQAHLWLRRPCIRGAVHEGLSHRLVGSALFLRWPRVELSPLLFGASLSAVLSLLAAFAATALAAFSTTEAATAIAAFASFAFRKVVIL